ncbi:ubiquitin carboxyl-terminal hydrolase CYLD-like [Paramuricea clavata]|uniref:Ubiquitin carboxyl-terminal hydrolase CYLD-like n=1 Tax=Paramuricea clavata TaxID=317549 RepID=A0A6S7G3E3_PARCT|nr:ubiquitin carboxyl-terminal hydrolase CYLD-like [Paramuricea clavata]
MATAPSLLNKIEEELECSLCLERLKDPRVFPQCQHSFCYGCIVKLSQGKSKIFCPECRAEVELGIPPDLSHFKRNTRINNILEYMGNDNLPDSIKPEVDQHKTNEAPECNEGTHTNHHDVGKSGAGVVTSGDEQQKPNNASKDNQSSVPPTLTDIVEMEPKRANVPALKGTRPSVPHTSDNNLNVESRFSYKSEDQVRKEQEHILNQIKQEKKEQKNTDKNIEEYQAGLESCDEQWRSKKEDKSRFKNHVSRETLQVNTHTKASKDNPPSVPPTSTDIVEIEPNVSEHRKDDTHLHSFYILLRERMAKNSEKNYSAMSSSIKCVSLLQGEILIRNVTTAVDESHGLIRLHSYSKPAYFCDCPLGDVKHISEEEARLLLAISTMGDRFKLLDNKSLLKNGKKIILGSYVYVKVRSVAGGSKQELRGIVRYKGPLPNKFGTWFGVELLEGVGRGTTNGMYKGVRFFRCQTDFGIFVSLEKLRLCEDQMETKSESKTDTKEANGTEESNSGVLIKVKRFAEDLSNFVLGEQPQEENFYSSEKQNKNNAGYEINDRVWTYVNDKLYGGCIKYIGRVPGGRETYAGIRLDHDVGQGNGEYYGKQLFTCMMNHAHFTPIINVISQDKLQELYDEQECANVPALRNNQPTVPRTSEEILNMESKFSNQSKDQVIKEQEMILQKIKQDQQQKMAKKKS